MSDQPQPFANGDNGGRDSRGRFAPGCKGGPGNPAFSAIGRIRAAFQAAIKEDDVEKALATLRELMAPGNPPRTRLAAAAEMLDRAIGKPNPADLLERVERLEQLLREREQTAGRN